MYHQRGHIVYIHKEYMDLWLWCIMSHHHDNTGLFNCYEEQQALHQHLTSPWEQAGSFAVAQQLLSQGRYESVLPNV